MADCHLRCYLNECLTDIHCFRDTLIVVGDIRVVPLSDSLVVVAFGLNNYHVHPCRTADGILARILIEVCTLVVTDYRIVETLDVPESLTFAPKLYSLLEYDFLYDFVE